MHIDLEINKFIAIESVCGFLMFVIRLIIKKMILIDSLYVNNSGGLVLLQYLVSILENRKYNTFYLIDERCGLKFLHIPDNRKCVMKASMYLRYKWYKKNINRFTKVLCFGNIPPPITVNSDVFTYFHNINLLNIPSSEQLKVKILSRFKRLIFRYLKKNTTKWVVQTENTKKELLRNLKEDESRVKILPFYNIVGSFKENDKRNGFIYASNYTVQKNFEFVVSCWEALAGIGFVEPLHLTLSNAPSSLIDMIRNANKNGANIINHGKISQVDLFKEYNESKAIIYAATNESLGLCLIEAYANGCDIIAPDLPYISSICIPSETFKLNSQKSFIDAVLNYSKNGHKSQLMIKNNIDELLYLLM